MKSIFNNDTTQKCQVAVTFTKDLVECGSGKVRGCSGRNIFGVWDLVCVKVKEGVFRDKTYISFLHAYTDD